MKISSTFLVLLCLFCGAKLQNSECPDFAPNCTVHQIVLWNEPEEGVKEINILAGDKISWTNFLPSSFELKFQSRESKVDPLTSAVSPAFQVAGNVTWEIIYLDATFTGGKAVVALGGTSSQLTINASLPFSDVVVVAGTQLILVNPTDNPITLSCKSSTIFTIPPYELASSEVRYVNLDFVDIWNCSTDATTYGRLLITQPYPRPAEYVDVSDPFVGETVGDNCTSAGECGSQYTGGSGCGSNGKCGGIGAWCFYDSVQRLSRQNIGIYCDKATTRNLQYECATNSTCVESVPPPANNVKTRTVADSNGVTRTESYIVTAGPSFSGVNTQEDIIRTVYEEIPWAISFFGIGLPMFTACCFIPCVCVCYKNRER